MEKFTQNKIKGRRRGLGSHYESQGVQTLLKGSNRDIHLDYKMLMREVRSNGQGDIIIIQQMLRICCEEVGENHG